MTTASSSGRRSRCASQVPTNAPQKAEQHGDDESPGGAARDGARNGAAHARDDEVHDELDDGHGPFLSGVRVALGRSEGVDLPRCNVRATAAPGWRRTAHPAEPWRRVRVMPIATHGQIEA